MNMKLRFKLSSMKCVKIYHSAVHLFQVNLFLTVMLYFILLQAITIQPRGAHFSDRVSTTSRF